MGELAGLFAPETVAVVGATDREGAVGRALLENLQEFDGRVIPVNPNRERVLGEPCYPTVGEVPQRVDRAVVAVTVDVAGRRWFDRQHRVRDRIGPQRGEQLDRVVDPFVVRPEDRGANPSAHARSPPVDASPRP